MATNKEQALIEVVLKGQQANASLKDMEKAVRSLSAQLKGLPKDSQQFADKKAEFQKMSKSLKDLKNDVKGVGGVFQSIGKEIKGFGVLAAGYLGFDWLASSVSGIIKNNAALSDSLADIRKTTGMTEAEARKLNTSFGQIDTRTAAKELRNIAIVGGQLGIAKGDIFGFTVAVDKMNVALGDEFTGGAEEVTKAMGGLRNIFSDIKTDKVDQDLLHIGNAINELASSGAATGPVVSDFANRIGGVGITLGLTSGQVLGLSATLQELNVSTERGGTAVTKILQKMTQNTGEFAKVAGIPVKEFTEMVNNNLYGAFVKVVEGSKKGNVSATEFGKTLDSLGVDGAGASEVFAKLGNNTGLLNEKVGLANTSLKGTSSIMNEFNMKNQTLGADLEKIGKGFSSWFSNSTFSDGLKAITSGLADLFDKTPEADRLTDAWRNQKAVVDDLESSMGPLLHRHDELKGKATLNKEEQSELDKIIAKVAETIPYAVTEFDKYGKAMDINTGKGREFFEMEKQKLELMNKDALTSRRLELIEYTKEITNFQKALQNRDADGDLFQTIKIKQDGIGDRSTYIFKDVKLTNEEIIKLNQNLLASKDKQLGVFAIINELTGKVVTSSKVAQEEIKTVSDTLSKEQEDAAKKAADEWAKFLEKLKQLEREGELNKMSGFAKELELTQDKYDKLRTEAKGNADALKRIKSLEDDDIMALIMKQAEKESAAMTKDFDEKLKKYKTLKEQKDKIENAPSNNSNLTAAEKAKKETDDLIKEWDERIDAAKNFNAALKDDEQQFSIDIVALTAAKNSQLEALNIKHNENITEENKKSTKKQISEFEKGYQNSIKVMDALNQAKHQMNEKEINDNDRKASNEIKLQKKLLDNKVISQKEYEKRIQKIEDEKDAKNLRIKQKQAKQDKEYAMFKIALNTAIGVSKALAEESYLEALAVGALGLIELGIAASTEIPQYAKGGYNQTSTKPEGYTTGSTLYTKSASGNPFIAGEAGTEWIASNWMVNDPVYGPQIGMLEAVQRRGFASGGNTGPAPVFSAPTSTGTQNKDINNLAAVVINLSQTVKSLQDNGISAFLNYDILQKDMGSIDSAKKSSQVTIKK